MFGDSSSSITWGRLRSEFWPLLPESPVRLMGGSLLSSAPVLLDDRWFEWLLFCYLCRLHKSPKDWFESLRKSSAPGSASVKPWPTKLDAFLFYYLLRALVRTSDGLSFELTLSSAKFFLSRSYEMLKLSSRAEFVCTSLSGTMFATRPIAMLPPLTPEMGEHGSFSLWSFLDSAWLSAYSWMTRRWFCIKLLKS